jgi:hypothetical protein
MRITSIENAIGNRITLWKLGVPILGFFGRGFLRTPLNPQCRSIPTTTYQEVPMRYKTIALELLHENPSLYEKLRSGKMLLTAMDAYAIDLKASHEAWKGLLTEENPGSDSRQISLEAMELAIQEIQTSLSCESEADEAEVFSLDEAISFVRPHTPNA